MFEHRLAHIARGVAAGTILAAMLMAAPTAAGAAEPGSFVTTLTANTVGADGGSAGSADAAASNPGTGIIRAGGATIASRIVTDGSSVVLSAEGNPQLIVMAQKDGARQPLSADGVLVVGRGGDLWVTVTGVAPETAVSIWSLSGATELAATRSDRLGYSGALVTLPADVEPGAQTLMVKAVDASGDPLTLQLGFELVDAAPASAPLYTPTTEPWTLPAPLLIMLAILVGALVALRHRESRTA